MKKISIFYGGFKNKEGGVITHAKILKKNLQKKNIVRLITLDSLPILLRFTPHILEKIINIFYFPLGFYYKGVLTGYYYNFFFCKNSYTNQELYIFEDIYLQWNSKIKSITFLHATWSDNLHNFKLKEFELNRLKKKELYKINNTISKIFTVSKEYQKFLSKFYKNKIKKKISVIYLGKDKENYNINIKRKKKYILYCGVLEKRKNLLFMLKAFKNLIKIDSQFRLNIIGNGPQIKELKKYASKHNLFVKFHGELSGLAKIKIFKSSSIYLHTSLKESFSYSLLEAKLYGLKTVSYKYLQVPQSLIDFKVENFNIEKWISKILIAYSSKNKRFSNLYSEKKMIKEILCQAK